MQTQELATIRRQAERDYAQLKRYKRARYSLARELGFSPIEAKVLSGRSEAYIRALADQLPKAS